MVTILSAVLCACSGSSSEEANIESDQSGGHADPAPIATVSTNESKPGQPTKVVAANVLVRFTESLLSGETTHIRQDLKIPEGYNDKQISIFIAELQHGKQISVDGVARIVESKFGTLLDRFPETAQQLAHHAKIDMNRAFAFGDRSAGAILHWDGERFRVAAVHNLTTVSAEVEAEVE